MWIFILFVLPMAGLAYTLWHIWCLLPFGGIGRGAVVAACALAFGAIPLNFSRTTDDLPMGLATASSHWPSPRYSPTVTSTTATKCASRWS